MPEPHNKKSLKAAVIGWPVNHSLSPRLHGYWLKQYGIEGSYTALPIEPEHFDTVFGRLGAEGYSGVNVTVPHKEATLRFIEKAGGKIDPLAKRIGAVNTVLFRADGTIEGRNTDAYGFAQNLLAGGYKPDGRPAMVLGAGGAARAVIVALQDMGVKDIHLANRTTERAEALAHELQTPQNHITPVVWDDAAAALKNVGLLVNTTSLGMKDEKAASYIDLSELPLSATVTDIVYVPLMTVLLKDAAGRGNPIIDGLGMLLHQARPAFAAFFGKEPEVTDGLRQFILEGK